MATRNIFYVGRNLSPTGFWDPRERGSPPQGAVKVRLDERTGHIRHVTPGSGSAGRLVSFATPEAERRYHQQKRRDDIQREREMMASAYGKALTSFEKESQQFLKEIAPEEARVLKEYKPEISLSQIRGRKAIPYRQRIKYVARQRAAQKKALEPFHTARSEISKQEAELKGQHQRWTELARRR